MSKPGYTNIWQKSADENAYDLQLLELYRHGDLAAGSELRERCVQLVRNVGEHIRFLCRLGSNGNYNLDVKAIVFYDYAVTHQPSFGTFREYIFECLVGHLLIESPDRTDKTNDPTKWDSKDWWYDDYHPAYTMSGQNLYLG